MQHVQSIRMIGYHGSFNTGCSFPFTEILDYLVEYADIGCYLRIEIALPTEHYDDEEEYFVVWARDFPVPKSTYPRWLQQELASLKRKSKHGYPNNAYLNALKLGFYTWESTLGQVERFRYLRTKDLEYSPQPYPEKTSWDPDAWVPYDPAFLVELAEKQHLDPKFSWLGPALRRAGTRVQWICGCTAVFVPVEERKLLDAEPRDKKYPYRLDLIHPTEGRISVYTLPKGRVSVVEFEDRFCDFLEI